MAVSHADPRRLGSQWSGPDGSAHVTQLGLDVLLPDVMDPGVYRRAEFDWRRSQLQRGTYPKAAFAAGKEGSVTLAVDIDSEGKPLRCAVSASSGAADLDAHACPHVLKNIRFVPTLPRDGVVRAETLSIALQYQMGPMMMFGPAEGGPPSTEAPEARPLSPIDAQLAGIAGVPAPGDVRGVGATFAVAPDGSVSACLLRVPTRIDELDKRICDNLIARARFDQAAPGTERVHRFWLDWRR